MQFQFNSDNQIDGTNDVAEEVETLVRHKLDRVRDHITRVEIHVGVENVAKGGVDKRATVEIRPASLAPVAGRATAATVEGAVGGAVDKALTAFDRVIGKHTTRKGH